MTSGKWLPLTALFLLVAAGVHAQEGTIVGTASDESKAVLPGVTVTATALDTGRQFVAVTSERGDFKIAGVDARKYKVQAELAGFATSIVPEVEVLVGQNVTVLFTLKVGGLNETVTVSGATPLVDTRSAQVAGNVDRRQMEELPIQGRNWVELTMMVKGITGNDVGNNKPGQARDTQFQLNLDGQQITQKVAQASLFGMPGISREAIAEYQVITDLFDISMGRSTGIQVQAISRSGTNTLSGSTYGYFRDDTLNAPDFVAGRVLPYANQQVGVTLGGPIVKNKVQYFLSFEYEREPNTYVVAPPLLAPNTLSLPTLTTKHQVLGRADYQVNSRNHVMVRASYYRKYSPFTELTGATYPTEGSDDLNDSHFETVNWSRTGGNNLLHEFKFGNYHYHWIYKIAESVALTPAYNFPGGLRIGGHSNYPEEFFEDMPSVRYDMTWHKGAHDIKIGGEFIYWYDSGTWLNNARGQFTFNAVPPDIARRFPLDAWNDPSRWDFTGLDATAVRFVQAYARPGGDVMDLPRPNESVWLGDNWKVRNNLTLTMGIRYDLDAKAFLAPHVNETQILINNGRDPVFDVGYSNTYPRDRQNVAPRVGFAWTVNDKADLVIRGGSGLFYGSPGDEPNLQKQLINGQNEIVNTYLNDGRPGFIQDPTRGVTAADILSGRVPLQPQAVTVVAHDYQFPWTWQSSLGFQKQLSDVLGIDSDLFYWHAGQEGTGRDPNLFWDPVTGFPKNPNIFGRPNPAYGPISMHDSKGKVDYMALASSLTRRYHRDFQGTVAYTLMFFKNDNNVGTTGNGGQPNNQFDQGAEWGRTPDFQRHTIRANAIYRLPWGGVAIASAFSYGSGNYFNTTSGVDIIGSQGTRVRRNFTIIPRTNFHGKPLHKLDLRLTKEIALGGVKLIGTAEVFNLYNHANYGSYNLVETSATYGDPRQNLATAYSPRSWQLGFKVSF